MSIPIMNEYNGLGSDEKKRIDTYIRKCDLASLVSELSRVLGRDVGESEARYLMLELNPKCLEQGAKKKQKAVSITEDKYYKPVDIDRELDFLFNFEKERLLVARQFEIENDTPPLSLVDKIVEVLLKIIELRVKSTSPEQGFEKLVKTIRSAIEGEEE